MEKVTLIGPTESELALLGRIEDLEVTLGVAREALLWSLEMFTARDLMNAKIHCAPLRLSPITERVSNALKEISQTTVQQARGKLNE